MKCLICQERTTDNRHAKDYNHANLKAKGNCAKLCQFCHTAIHQLNNKNNLDWDYLMKNKKQEIIEKANQLYHNFLRNGGRGNSKEFSKPLPAIKLKEVKI